jgi:hypothetical protein
MNVLAKKLKSDRTFSDEVDLGDRISDDRVMWAISTTGVAAALLMMG